MSKFFKALHEADRERALQEPGPRPIEAAPALTSSVVVTPEMGQRLTRWIEEGAALARALPLLLAEHDRLRARAEAAEQRSERLREELDEVAETLGQMLNETVRQATATLQRLRRPPRPA